MNPGMFDEKRSIAALLIKHSGAGLTQLSDFSYEVRKSYGVYFVFNP